MSCFCFVNRLTARKRQKASQRRMRPRRLKRSGIAQNWRQTSPTTNAKAQAASAAWKNYGKTRTTMLSKRNRPLLQKKMPRAANAFGLPPLRQVTKSPSCRQNRWWRQSSLSCLARGLQSTPRPLPRQRRRELRRPPSDSVRLQCQAKSRQRRRPAPRKAFWRFRRRSKRAWHRSSRPKRSALPALSSCRTKWGSSTARASASRTAFRRKAASSSVSCSPDSSNRGASCDRPAREILLTTLVSF